MIPNNLGYHILILHSNFPNCLFALPISEPSRVGKHVEKNMPSTFWQNALFMSVILANTFDMSVSTFHQEQISALKNTTLNQ